VRRLQQEKPQTYEALGGLIEALAANPNEDALVASVISSISGQLAQGAEEAGPRSIPQAQNNTSGRPYDEGAVAAQTRPANARPLPGATP